LGAGSGRALVGLLLVLAIDLPSSSRDQGSWGGAAGAAGVRGGGRGHHPSRLWCCGHPIRAALALPVAMGQRSVQVGWIPG
jgi:hypothetical protein